MAMTKRPSRLDFNQLAAAILSEATGENEITPSPKTKDEKAIKRGKARADSLSKEEREAIATKAANIRWNKN